MHRTGPACAPQMQSCWPTTHLSSAKMQTQMPLLQCRPKRATPPRRRCRILNAWLRLSGSTQKMASPAIPLRAWVRRSQMLCGATAAPLPAPRQPPVLTGSAWTKFIAAGCARHGTASAQVKACLGPGPAAVPRTSACDATRTGLSASHLSATIASCGRGGTALCCNAQQLLEQGCWLC